MALIEKVPHENKVVWDLSLCDKLPPHTRSFRAGQSKSARKISVFLESSAIGGDNKVVKERKRVRTYSSRIMERKPDRKWMMAYALRGGIPIFLFFMSILMVCGVFLYMNEHTSAEEPVKNTLVPSQNLAVTEPSVAPVPSKKPSKMQVVLDAGHGGKQPGTVMGDVLEKDITLSITLLLQKKLEAKGAEVIMTRNTDQDVSLPDRSQVANDAEADCFVSIHCNSYEDPSVHGFECYYYQSEEGKTLADTITQTADSHSISTRRVKEADFAVLRETFVPAVLIEVGFLTNEQERGNLLSTKYQEQLADAITDGIFQCKFSKTAGRTGNTGSTSTAKPTGTVSPTDTAKPTGTVGPTGTVRPIGAAKSAGTT